MPKDKNIVEPIKATLDEVVDSILQPAPSNVNKINNMAAKMALQPAPSKQLVLDIGPKRKARR